MSPLRFFRSFFNASPASFAPDSAQTSTEGARRHSTRRIPKDNQASIERRASIRQGNPNRASRQATRQVNSNRAIGRSNRMVDPDTTARRSSGTPPQTESSNRRTKSRSTGTEGTEATEVTRERTARGPSTMTEPADEAIQRPGQVAPTSSRPRTASRDGSKSSSLWATEPVKRALDILLDNSNDVETAADAIMKDMERNNHPEPTYAFRDAEIRDFHWQIMDLMERFARKHFDFDFSGETVSPKQYKRFPPETAKVIACIASGGPQAQDGWHQFFIDKQKRRALVCGILGNVIVEQVYKHMFFGSGDAQSAELQSIRARMKNEEGFDRKKSYAGVIREVIGEGSGSEITLPPGFDAHVKVVLAALSSHLDPILHLDARYTIGVRSEDFTKELYSLIVKAGILSIFMQSDPDTVFHFPPIFKEERFEPNAMDCFNIDNIEEANPKTRSSWPDDYTEDDKERAQGDGILTQITMMAGITAYRRGGWENVTIAGEEEQAQWERAKVKGIRDRVLTQGWVYCRWGRARRFYRGEEKNNPLAHGKEWRGGFKEFTDVEGVPNWEDRNTGRA